MNSTPKWQIFITEDGSPTLSWSRADGYTEKMHHSGGALTESLFIYQTALLEVLTRGWPVRILSLGLGLAYNELIAMAELMKAGVSDWLLWSFESEDSLRDGFTEWLIADSKILSSDLQDSKDAILTTIHSQVCQQIAQQFEISAVELKTFARQALQAGRLQLLGRFPESAQSTRDCTCVFYDAYSKKMDADLWNESVLADRLRPLLSPTCVLCTYAATGAMNRTLKSLGFRLLPRSGFQGKRESTLAIRE